MQKPVIYLCIATTLLAAGATHASAQQVSFARHFKIGQSYSYRTTSTSTGGFAMNMKMDTQVRVVKVYPNGDADLLTKITNYSNYMNGKAMPAPSMPQKTQRVNKFGVTQGNAAGGSVLGMSGADLTGMMPKVMRVGQSITSHVGTAGSPVAYTYKMTLNSVTGNIAHVGMTIVMTFSSPQAKVPPMHGSGTMLYDIFKENFTTVIFSMNMPSMGGKTGKMTSKTVLLSH